ncbi:unnamed protein product [Rhizophagus irregularis]|nr:unnamed protein product [Rhizophagus irregularis]
MPNICPFSDGGKDVDIKNHFLILIKSRQFQLLSNRMNERFILSSPILRMEGVENTGSQPVKEPPKPLVYLTCKHIMHYECIINPQKLCLICPSTDMEPEEEMEIDNDDIVTDVQESSTTQKKCTKKSTTKSPPARKRRQLIRTMFLLC